MVAPHGRALPSLSRARGPNADAPHSLGLLRARRERPRRRTPEKCDELAASDESCHLIPPAGRATERQHPHRSVSGFTSGTIA